MLKLSSLSFQTPSAIDRFNPPLSKSTSTFSDTAHFTTCNPSLVSGRQSPVYVAVPVDRPPVKVKPKTHISTQDTVDISTINELRSKLLNVDDQGWVQPKVKTITKSNIEKVLLYRFHLNGSTLEFHP